MATHGFQRGDRSSRPDSIPLELSSLPQLSWELGSRIVDDATRHSEWVQTGNTWGLSIFRATSNTLVLRIRTPVGREKFYGAASVDLDATLSTLEAASNWTRRV
ncbi:hypothetical protein D8Y22_16320 [Salinadaptatus halalkaliphilus]|uniref:Uncharacterized protein n=1 Tax=Salinadaptatus halalkaliphilus TaxID=2419781 RepID=A0A4V3VL16_9EURY|nr:hypothetical protein [Salinadaptatus halalkaliphilus]THE63887.1 hypothetical protein D8Y22_16320 [Salinadaptatus halalkaliphilus]